MTKLQSWLLRKKGSKKQEIQMGLKKLVTKLAHRKIVRRKGKIRKPSKECRRGWKNWQLSLASVSAPKKKLSLFKNFLRESALSSKALATLNQHKMSKALPML